MGNILVVDDDYLDVMSVQRAFRKLNLAHNVVVAHNGKDAYNMLKGIGTEKITPRPQVMLLDINMPKMNGLELLEEIRNDAELRDLKVFVMTTSEEESDRIEAQRFGISGYIIKPVNFDTFSQSSSMIDNFDLLVDLLKN